MGKLSELKNEAALDALADILEPAAEILTDEKVRGLYNGKEPRVKLAAYIIKNHKASIIAILAGLDGVPAEEYEVNILTLPIVVMELLNDKELLSFFSSSAPLE